MARCKSWSAETMRALFSDLVCQTLPSPKLLLYNALNALNPPRILYFSWIVFCWRSLALILKPDPRCLAYLESTL